MLGGTVTVNVTPALASPPTVTTTFPVVAPVGTVTVMLVALQLVAVPPLVPLNVTVLVPWLAPKLLPLFVTEPPTGPEVTDKLVMLGAGGVTVNATPPLVPPDVVTVTLFDPVAALAPIVNVAVICVALTTVTLLTVIPLLPGLTVAPLMKFVPVRVTGTAAPCAPLLGLTPVSVGTDAVTVNATPLLATPPTFTTTFPLVAPLGTVTVMLVALQLVAVAAVPLNVTVLPCWLAPKLLPLITTEAPTAAELGLIPLITGVACTVKLTPALATPPTFTTTFPVVAPL